MRMASCSDWIMMIDNHGPGHIYYKINKHKKITQIRKVNQSDDLNNSVDKVEKIFSVVLQPSVA